MPGFLHAWWCFKGVIFLSFFQAQYVFIYDVTDMLIMKKLAEEGVQCTNNADDGNHQNDAYGNLFPYFAYSLII